MTFWPVLKEVLLSIDAMLAETINFLFQSSYYPFLHMTAAEQIRLVFQGQRTENYERTKQTDFVPLGKHAIFAIFLERILSSKVD